MSAAAKVPEADGLRKAFGHQAVLKAASFSATRGADRVDPVGEELRLANLVGRKPTRMSGSERQRASLGLALVRAPACLLMDEPFAGVAPRDRPLIARGLERLRTQGAAIVISGHDVEDLFAVADQVIWVVAGTSHRIGTPEDAKDHAQFRPEYLGSKPSGVARPSPPSAGSVVRGSDA